MGTNFYLATKSKEIRDKYFGWKYEIVDEPDWGYEIHIAKTSCGWLPLFQMHDCFKSIRQLKELYDTGEFIIYDEYHKIYNWEEFDERVLKFNGGVRGAIPREYIEQDTTAPWFDPAMPNWSPVSHLEYANGAYSNTIFVDQDGYEFDYVEFC